MNEQTEQDPWVIRTDFTNHKVWQEVCDQIATPQGDDGFIAYVRYIDDPGYRDQIPSEVAQSLPDTYADRFCFIVDRKCITTQEHPILVVGFYPSDDESFDRLPRHTPLSGIRTFRAVPAQVQSIENNLSLANMDFEEFTDAVDSDGVFRGFR